MYSHPVITIYPLKVMVITLMKLIPIITNKLYQNIDCNVKCLLYFQIMHFIVVFNCILLLYLIFLGQSDAASTDGAPATPSPTLNLYTPPVPPMLPDSASQEEVGLVFCIVISNNVIVP